MRNKKTMMTFRQKIFLSYFVVFILLIALIVPITRRSVKNIMRKGMEDRATELIEQIRHEPNNDALVARLKHSKVPIFFRVTVIAHERRVIYDSHIKRILGVRFNPNLIVNHPEVSQAFKEGTGYHEDYSILFEQDFSYFAKSFNFNGKTYVLRTAFPLRYVEEVTKDFELGFLVSAAAVLLLFSLTTWFIITYLSRPIQRIIQAVKPYQEGQTQVIPRVHFVEMKQSDEFGQLADTLNSLSERIQNHIDILTVERNEKEAILESLVEGVVSVNNTMIITYINTTAARFLQIDAKEAVGQDAKFVRNEQCLKLLERCQVEEKVLIETIELRHPEGKHYLEIVAAPKKDVSGAILVLQDKTQHYRIIEMRKDFVANASHELKTPITIIRGFAETLHDNPGLPEETQGQITEKIVRNCKKMTELIKDLLTLTDIEHIPQSRLEEIDLSELVQKAQATLSDAHPEAKIVLEYASDDDYNLQVDPNLIELCITNLLENAVKYSAEPAEIKITLKRTEDWIAIAIQDKGYGIPKEDVKNIFQRFYRSNKAYFGKKIGGSGLGLAIVEMIIDKHFGKISVESEEGKGSIFTVCLPVQRRSGDPVR